ncbi:hypothetical protein [Clavibacter michiganensis]|uniref:hypothetical protein n=1 Tax=Clavibacter michiganensis TaxID=28447 RepID=UPI0005B9FCE3|nr:hypothetical protein [Clavibacter michiganensis]
MSVDTTSALLYVALGALFVGMALQCVGAWKGLREHGRGRAKLFARPVLPWTLASLGWITISILCCVAFLSA